MARPPTGLVWPDGDRADELLAIARELPETPLVFVCNGLAPFAAALHALACSAPRRLAGDPHKRTAPAPQADFLIGRVGTACLSAAARLELPVVLARGARTAPEFGGIVDWIEEQGLGIVVDDFNAVAPAVRDLLADLAGFRANARARAADRAPAGGRHRPLRVALQARGWESTRAGVWRGDDAGAPEEAA